jgi:hypothetical protein
MLTESGVDRTVLLNAPSDVTTLPLGAMRTHDGKPRPLLTSVLYAGSVPFELRRVGPRTLEMHVTRGWLSTPLERLARDVGAEPFVVGRVYRLPGLTARVLSVNACGAPTAMHFEFDAALEDPRVLWLRFDGRRAVRWTPPAIGSVEHMPAAATIF